jgi:hypothetical protein
MTIKQPTEQLDLPFTEPLPDDKITQDTVNTSIMLNKAIDFRIFCAMMNLLEFIDDAEDKYAHVVDSNGVLNIWEAQRILQKQLLTALEYDIGVLVDNRIREALNRAMPTG